MKDVDYIGVDPISELLKAKGDKSLTALAREIGCSTPYLSDVLNHRREVGPLLLKYLGLTRKSKRITTYKKI